MRHIVSRTVVVAAILCMATLPACGHAQHLTAEVPPSTIVWPAAPEQPRIRYLQEVREPSDLLPRPSWWRRLLTAVKGGQDTSVRSPHGLTKDADGRLYVVDSAYRAVHVFDPVSGRYHRFPKRPPEGFANPVGVAVTGDGKVLVTDSVAGVVHVFVDRGRSYQGVIGAETLKRPTGITVDPATGDILVMDTLDSKLVVFDGHDLKEKVRVGGNSQGEYGFHYPTGVTASANGDIYVADTLNFRVQALNPERQFRKSFGEAGDAPGYFSRPKAVAVDSEHHVYVVDALFDNVQIFDAEGRLLLAFGKPGSGPGEFWLPNAILIDRQDRIYISDPHNHRVQVFQYVREGGS